VVADFNFVSPKLESRMMHLRTYGSKKEAKKVQRYSTRIYRVQIPQHKKSQEEAVRRTRERNQTRSRGGSLGS